MRAESTNARARKLVSIAYILAVVLFFKSLASIIYEYRHYFPPDFEVPFLMGRYDYFFGWYQYAFYLHIIVGPIVLLLAALLMSRRFRVRFRSGHRMAGKVQALLVLFVLLPSGFLMALKPNAGPIAGAGFVAHGLATGIALILAIQYARKRDFRRHETWATRCFILLSAPLLFRWIAGIADLTGTESDLSYQISAWLSWTLPLFAYDAYRMRTGEQRLIPNVSPREVFE